MDALWAIVAIIALIAALFGFAAASLKKANDLARLNDERRKANRRRPPA